jgi:hypothetical protein
MSRHCDLMGELCASVGATAAARFLAEAREAFSALGIPRDPGEGPSKARARAREWYRIPALVRRRGA